jgi:hypothetical protein
MENSKLSTKQIVHKIYTDPKYSGKHVLAIAGKIFAMNTGNEAAKVFARETKKYPNETPLGTYIPKADTLILWF